MPGYRYQARDSRGQQCAGVIEAANVSQAVALLADQALEVLSIHLAVDESEGLSSDKVLPIEYARDNEVTGLEVRPEYLRRIDEALSHRAQLLELLQAISDEQSRAKVSNQLPYLIQRLEQGVTAEEFVEDARLSVWLPMVLASRDVQAWHQNSTRWLSQVTNEQRRTISWWWSLSYPLFLVFFGLLVLVPLCVLIVPTFKKMFSEFGLTLPPPTRLLISISDLILGYPLLLSLGLIFLLSLLAVLPRYWYAQRFTTQWLGMLTAGSTPNLLAMSRLTSVLAELLDLGASLPDAFSIAGRASRHAYFRYVCDRLADDLRMPGVRWQDSRSARTLPMSVMHALTAQVDNFPSVPLLRELSQVYSQRAYRRQAIGAGLATPLVVLMVGTGLGFVVISLFMPLVQLVTSLT